MKIALQMYVQCSFCGYLNEHRATTPATVVGVCALCHELLPQDVVVGWQQFMQDVRPPCPQCARELLLNNTCSYCTAIHAMVPYTLLTRLSFFSEVLRGLNMQPQPGGLVAEVAAPAAHTAPAQEGSAAPAAVRRRPVPRQASNIWQPATTLWSPRFAPPPFTGATAAARLSLPALDFTMLDLDTLLFSGEGAGDHENEQGGLTEQARATLLRPPAAVADDFVCGVCLAPHEGDAALTELPCAHVFHAACVNQWFMNHRTCPMCRQLVQQRSQEARAQDASQSV